ncbi:putative Parkin co-regulated protein [Monocercomonoides exilis]|uniref:putative Parkin co-regulated protein n=1 Tax=Monocercomonoides exilis TaxID=2049356 RepID=UPI00355940B8|nr:putative Parkin co-regulated protein [Monocercomonoides exilis]|eukprot:MONOS_10840.1-p1 / transcript=MONOS_10840.1 / gene=MONOS_10840 / organism=Monocercomonoides_exilis_PA203 / gene_product=Parkin co-regulated protein / transcript_product=Parkin co-regulated protein / location=Mono_scaffold00509:44259-45164(-) / protein_length=255 / sequence_SO=supercontig / SO=protein_coding / is_pseudo=false
MSYRTSYSQPKSSLSTSKVKAKAKSSSASSVLASPTSLKISSSRFDSIPRGGGFGSKTGGKTAFAVAYSNGSIPCRLVTGTAKMALEWKQTFEEIDYESILPLCVEGLKEIAHPYFTVAKMACIELVSAEIAHETIPPILPEVIKRLREVMVTTSRSNLDAFATSLEFLIGLSNAVTESLTPHITLLLSPIAAEMMKAGSGRTSSAAKSCTKTPGGGGEINLKEKSLEVLQILEENGGEEAYEIIHKKIPTYSR